MIKKMFFTDGAITRVVDIDQDNLNTKLPPKVYTIQENPIIGIHLVETENKMKQPERIYGETQSRAERIVNTYKSRDVSTGVLLTGEKGSGKTMLSTLIATKMLADKIPVVIVNDALRGTKFIEFVNSLGNCMLIFDEFAKVYGTSKRENVESAESTILTILDGTNKQKRLAILIENNKWSISEYLLNRPGRIYYHFEYSKLSKEVVHDYCKSLQVPEVINDLMLIRNNMRTFNFDMMQALVEEYKRYGGKIIEHAKVINIDFDTNRLRYDVVKLVDNKTGKLLQVDDQHKVIETGGYDLDTEIYTKKGRYIRFRHEHCKIEENGTAVLDNGEFTIILKKQVQKFGDYTKYVK